MPAANMLSTKKAVFHATYEGTLLEDVKGAALYIGADSPDEVMAAARASGHGGVLSVIVLADARAGNLCDVELPGGNMALIALMLTQWGDLPCASN